MSFHVDTEKLIEQAIAKEYENATAIDEKLHKGKVFNSLHEGYGVLMEELWEAKKEFFHATKYKKLLLSFIIDNEKGWLKETLENRINCAKNAMAELAQVAAVCQKMLDTIEAQEVEE